MLAPALHIVGNPILIYKYDVYAIVTCIERVYERFLGVVCAFACGRKINKTVQVDSGVMRFMIDSFMICVCV